MSDFEFNDDVPGVDSIRLVRRSGAPIGDLTEATLEYIEWEENGPGSAEFSISPLADNAELCQLKTKNCEVLITNANGEQFWGWLEARTGNLSSVKYHCVGYFGYFGPRFIDGESLYFGEPTPQQDIAAALINYAQQVSGPGAGDDLRIIPRFVQIAPEVPILRLRDYKRSEHPSILDLLMELTKVNHPLGYRMTIEEDVDFYPYERYKRYIDIFYSYRGLLIHPLSHPLQLILGDDNNNILDLDFNEDGGSISNHVYATGGSAGDVRFEENFSDSESIQQRGLWQAIISEGDNKDPGWLLDRATMDVAERKDPLISLGLSAVYVPDKVGYYMKPGDSWPVKIDYGSIQVDDVFVCTSKRWLKNHTYRVELEKISTNSRLPAPELFLPGTEVGP